MKKVVLYGPNDVRIDDLPEPQPGPDDVVIRFLVSSICYTDVKLVSGVQPREYPVGFGHDAAGVVASVGSNVSSVRVGERVVTEQFLGCGVCHLCSRGRADLCIEQPSFYARGYQAGWFTDYFVTPADHLLPLPNHVSMDDGATLEPFVIALQTHRVVQYASGSTVVVVGAGGMGWGQIQVAKKLHNCRVVAVDLFGNRLELARQLGADATFNDSEIDAAEEVRAFCGPEGPDLVIDTTGSDAGCDRACQLAALGGDLALIGAQGTFSAQTVVRSGLRIFTVRGGAPRTRTGQPGVREEAIRLIADGTLNLQPAISHRFQLDHIRSALDLLHDPYEPVNKVVLDHGPEIID